jgi:hypothetical protein
MKILSLLAIIFGFSQCGSAKFDMNPPFKIDSASYTNWVGGQPGVRGTKVEIVLTEKLDIVFDSLFFNNKKTKLENREIDQATFLIGHFTTSKNQDKILHLDSKKEIKNEAPEKIKFPFELKNNEAVISYFINNKTHYYKLETLKEVKKRGF